MEPRYRAKESTLPSSAISSDVVDVDTIKLMVSIVRVLEGTIPTGPRTISIMADDTMVLFCGGSASDLDLKTQPPTMNQKRQLLLSLIMLATAATMTTYRAKSQESSPK